MPFRRLRIVPSLSVLGLLALLVSSPAAAGDRNGTCLAREVLAVGKRVVAVAGCHAAAIARGAAVAPECLARGEARCCVVVPRAGCVSVSQQAGFAAEADDVIDDFVAALTPSTAGAPKCVAAKRKLAARAAAATLGCHAKALRSGRPLDATCATTVAAKLRTAWARAEKRSGCLVAGDVDAILARLAVFGSAVVTVAPSPTPQAPTPTPTPPVPTPTAGSAVYDVNFTFDPPVPAYVVPAVGTLLVRDDGEISLRVIFHEFNSLQLFGDLDGDADVALTGSMIIGGDIYFSATGSVTVSRTASEERIEGSVGVPQTGQTIALTMTRPTSGTPAAFAGTYTLGFPTSPGCACSSTASIGMDVPASGHGTTTAAEERNGAATLVGAFRDGGWCDVAPSGRTFCRLTYDAVDPNTPGGHCGAGCQVQAIGNLVAGPAGVTGGGSFMIGDAPSVYLENGVWTAAK